MNEEVSYDTTTQKDKASESENEHDLVNGSEESSESSSLSDSKESQGEGENKIAGVFFGNGLNGFIDDDKSVISGVDDSDIDEDFFMNQQNLTEEDLDEEDEEEIRLTSSDEEGESKGVKRKVKMRLILNVSQCQYSVVRDVGRALGFAISEAQIDDLDNMHKYDFDLMWLDGGVSADRM